MILFVKQEYRHRHREQTYGYQGGKVVGWDDLGYRDGHI